MYSKTKQFIRKNTISFAGLAAILILISGSVSATNPSVENVCPANGSTLYVNTIDFQCDVYDGGQILNELGLYVDGSTDPVETINSPVTGTYTFSNVPVANGPHTYYCAVYASGFFSSSDSWSFTVTTEICDDEMDNDGDDLIDCDDDDCIGFPGCPDIYCEECPTPLQCYGWCPPGQVCVNVEIPTYIPRQCACMPEITTTTTTVEDTTTTVEDTTTTVEDTTTTVEDTTTTIPAVPEFASLTVALIILLTTPAFAYLIVKKKELIEK